jgi:hypothetical protein
VRGCSKTTAHVKQLICIFCLASSDVAESSFTGSMVSGYVTAYLKNVQKGHGPEQMGSVAMSLSRAHRNMSP